MTIADNADLWTVYEPVFNFGGIGGSREDAELMLDVNTALVNLELRAHGAPSLSEPFGEFYLVKVDEMSHTIPTYSSDMIAGTFVSGLSFNNVMQTARSTLGIHITPREYQHVRTYAVDDAQRKALEHIRLQPFKRKKGLSYIAHRVIATMMLLGGDSPPGGE